MSGSGRQPETVVVTHSPDETRALGCRIGKALRGGEVIALTGPLGSGKTQLVKGIAAGAGAGGSSLVSSPTFVLINEYPPVESGLYIYHIDAYRIESQGEFEMLGFDELCFPESVVIIEWADKVRQCISRIQTVDIEMAYRDEMSRSIIFRILPDYLAELFV